MENYKVTQSPKPSLLHLPHSYSTKSQRKKMEMSGNEARKSQNERKTLCLCTENIFARKQVTAFLPMLFILLFRNKVRTFCMCALHYFSRTFFHDFYSRDIIFLYFLWQPNCEFLIQKAEDFLSPDFKSFFLWMLIPGLFPPRLHRLLPTPPTWLFTSYPPWKPVTVDRRMLNRIPIFITIQTISCA